jgi:hypothetical protein
MGNRLNANKPEPQTITPEMLIEDLYGFEAVDKDDMEQWSNYSCRSVIKCGAACRLPLSVIFYYPANGNRSLARIIEVLLYHFTFGVCVCSILYSACNAYVPYCNVWYVRLYNICPHYFV